MLVGAWLSVILAAGTPVGAAAACGLQGVRAGPRTALGSSFATEPKALPQRSVPTPPATGPRSPSRRSLPPVVDPFAVGPAWPRAFPQAHCAPQRGLGGEVATFAAGAVGAFLAHELGHVAANLLAGNVPRLVGLRGTGGVPFFAIAPDVVCRAGHCVGSAGQRLRGGRRLPYLIAAAGFQVQHLGNEVLLSQAPPLRARHATFARGWLAFNLALSVGYAAASLAHVEDPHGDAGGLASYARVPRGVVAAALLMPAALDAWRFVRPQDRWAPWASRAGKVGIFGLAWRS